MNLFFILLILFNPLTFALNAVEEFESSNKKFTASLYKELEKNERGNLFFSPFSAQTILSLAQSGAKNKTAEEMKKALYLPSQKKLEEAIKSLKPSLKIDALQIANKIYLQKDLKIKNDFHKVAKIFNSELENIDFENGNEAAKILNDWVENKTNHKIRDLVSGEVLDEQTKSVFINALHLKDDWSFSFKKFNTKDADFFKNDGKHKIQVPTMHQTKAFNYYESKELDAKFLELSLKSNASFTIVLPNQKKGVAQLSKNAKIFDRPQYQNELVSISLPKFKMESRFDLGDTLKNLGIKKAFKVGEADFSGIAGKKGELIISEVVQKAFIDVNERGIEAAAATSMEMVSKSGVDTTLKPKKFIADHPFIFYIKIKNLILFVGKVVDPKE